MTKEELAKLLDGKEYREDISLEIQEEALDSGLVIIYGHSDDLMEVEGKIQDEGSCYEGETFLIDSNGLMPPKDDIEDEDELEAWLKRKKSCKEIEAVWCADNEPAWTYKTSIPHVTFNVMEDGEIQCRGIVFSVNDL